MPNSRPSAGPSNRPEETPTGPQQGVGSTLGGAVRSWACEVRCSGAGGLAQGSSAARPPEIPAHSQEQSCTREEGHGGVGCSVSRQEPNNESLCGDLRPCGGYRRRP
ncbi:hypothetical protein NDU88_007478 [Pleurodeles waltl]|uniref:Uncharacterized protein n=1 Tax=Pleurodeles waltl TaxID=8319 RepID=A0AAV7RTC8_PLEWA|nr:hypothetical protein NDU88_007478 [Pleurodeles waltl]